MSVGFSSKPNSCMHATTLLLAAFLCDTVQSFKPDPAHYNTPHEAIEYVAWKALKEGKPPCVTVHPIGISLFCIMGQCVQEENGSSYCQCSQHFTGLTCSVYKGKCTSESICSPHLCKDNPNKISMYECVCKPGYHVPDSPAFSHCIPDSILSSAIGEMHNENSTNTTALLFTDTADEELAKTITLLNFPVNNARTPLTPVTVGSNATQPALICKSSGSHVHFIHEKEENKTADVFMKAVQNTIGQDEPAETTEAAETSSLGTVLKNQQKHAADRDDDEDKMKEGVEEYITKSLSSPPITVALLEYNGVNENSGTISHVGLSSAPITLSEHNGQLLSAPQQHNKRAMKLQVPVIQRRCASTFQSEQDGNFEIQLALDDLTPYKADSEEGVDKKEESLITALKFKYHIATISHLGNQVTELKHIISSTTVPQQPFQKESLNKDDYEVTQIGKRLSKMAPTKLFRNEENSDSSLHRPVAHLVTSETKKMKARKSYFRHKQKPVEAQDDIIDSLKHAVEVDEYSKANIISKPLGRGSEVTKRTIMVPEKRRLRKSSSLQENKAVYKASTEQKRLTTSSVLASEKRDEISRLMQQHKPVWSVRQHFSKKNRLQEATYRPSPNDEGIGHLQKYSIMSIMDWKENTLSQNRDKITHPRSDATSFRNDMLKDNSALSNASEWVHEIKVSEAQHQVTSTTKTQVPTCCYNSSLLTSDQRSKTSLVLEKFLDESIDQSVLTFIGNRAKLGGKSQSFRTQDYVKTNDSPHEKKTKRHFSGKNPLLYFNVTVLSDGGRNKSSASYLVPFSGRKAIMISWGAYNEDTL